jgi:hypothetical protein
MRKTAFVGAAALAALLVTAGFVAINAAAK